MSLKFCMMLHTFKNACFLLCVCLCVWVQYVETLDLSGLISITDDSSPDRNLDAARLVLQMKDGTINITVRMWTRKTSGFHSSDQKLACFSLTVLLLCLQVPSAEARELWKGFIHSVTEV